MILTVTSAAVNYFERAFRGALRRNGWIALTYLRFNIFSELSCLLSCRLAAQQLGVHFEVLKGIC